MIYYNRIFNKRQKYTLMEHRAATRDLREIHILKDIETGEIVKFYGGDFNDRYITIKDIRKEKLILLRERSKNAQAF